MNSNATDIQTPTSSEPQSPLPWLLILLGWLLVLGVMSVVVVIAVRNAPQPVPLDPSPKATHGH